MRARTSERSTHGSREACEGTPLYVHLPFCAAKCHYCDFFSVPAEGQDIGGTLDAIAREIEVRAPRRPRTVFLGGGTPSLLDVDQLRFLLNLLHERTGFRDSALEVTAECNPESLTADKVRCLLDHGVTRLSIGFQSLQPEVLTLFGRVHSVDESFRAFEAARDGGAKRVNIDMIYAIPGQTLDQWQQDLERVLALRPDHLSAYNLTFEHDTTFRRWLEQGKLKPLPDEVELEFFWWTRRRLAQAGLWPYEISNFATNGQQCSHNVNYWHNGPYVGIGPSAVSKESNARFGNAKNLGDYRRRVAAEGHAETWRETPTAWARLAETWWLGLRLHDGLSAEEAWTRSGLAEWDVATDPSVSTVARMAEGGWLEQHEGRWRLTDRGWPVADAIAREFLRLGHSEDAAAETTATFASPIAGEHNA